MLRSFDYAAWSALERVRMRRSDAQARVARRAFAWRDQAVRDFLGAYWPLAEASKVVPQDVAARSELLTLFTLQKAFYEVMYEAASRPAWIAIPIKGLLALIDPRDAAS
jgi:maltose alpha-D-glucosyltransferase/alpha-amylase